MRLLASVVAAIEAVMMVVVMVMVAVAGAGHDDDAGTVTVRVSAMVVVMVMMMVMMTVKLGKLDIFVRRLGRSGFIDRLQQRGRVRDRLQQLSEGIGP
jgi:hypothetical protein